MRRSAILNTRICTHTHIYSYILCPCTVHDMYMDVTTVCRHRSIERRVASNNQLHNFKEPALRTDREKQKAQTQQSMSSHLGTPLGTVRRTPHRFWCRGAVFCRRRRSGHRPRCRPPGNLHKHTHVFVYTGHTSAYTVIHVHNKYTSVCVLVSVHVRILLLHAHV